MIVALILASLLLVFITVKTLRKPPAPTRDNVRLPLATTVHMRFGDQELDATGIDLSKSGICVTTAQAASPGQPVDLSFLLPNQHRVMVHGVVRWCRQGRMGVLFDFEAEPRLPIYVWVDEMLSRMPLSPGESAV